MALIEISKDGRAKYVGGEKVELREALIARTLHGFCLSHPCLGARAASGSGGLFMTVHQDMSTVESAFGFLQDLKEYYSYSDGLEPTRKSLGAAFYAEPIASQDQFAQKYWGFAQLLHDIDCLDTEWDRSVSADIEDGNFELSLAGRALFTTTLNPQNPRFARRFSYPIWIINQHEQFNHLRRTGRFTDWQNRIRELDSRFDPTGQPNPILADHGYESAADQLAGSKPERQNFELRDTYEKREEARKILVERATSEGAAEDVVFALQHMDKPEIAT